MALLFSSICGLSQKTGGKNIQLEKHCFFDAPNRFVVDTLLNKSATISKKGKYLILIIGNIKYLPCNLPSAVKQKKIVISGYILNEFETEKVIATPLQLTKVETLN